MKQVISFLDQIIAKSIFDDNNPNWKPKYPAVKTPGSESWMTHNLKLLKELIENEEKDSSKRDGNGTN
jgi:hypothetical protein